MVKYCPDSREIVWLDFDPQKGKEINKTRPALTISSYSYNMKSGLGLFMPITSKVKGYPFEILVECEKIKGAILSDQIRSLDWKSRNAKFICKLLEEDFEEAVAKFKVLLPS